MKRTFMKTLKSLLALGVFIIASCNGEEPANNGNGNGNENENNAPNTEFKIEVSNLEYDNLTITITPPDDAPIFYACLYPDTEKAIGLDDEQLLENILETSNFNSFLFEGEQDLKYAGLVGNSHYRLIYFSYDNEFDLPFGEFHRSERITTPDGPAKFDIEVSNVSGMSAKLKITPEDPDMTYTYYIEDMEKFQNEKNGSDYELIQYDYSYWNFLASTYDSPIEDIISEWLYSGTTDEYTDSFYGLLEWDCEYMAYAYGVDKKGNMLSHMAKETFKTNAPAVSDVTFDIVNVSTRFYYEENAGYAPRQGWVMEADIKPSNPDEKYFVTITNNDWYDWYYGPNNTGRSDTKYIQQQILQNTNRSAEGLKEMYKQGDYHYDSDAERGTLGKPNKEYVVLVFGMDDNGATTGITEYVFKTEAFPTM